MNASINLTNSSDLGDVSETQSSNKNNSIQNDDKAYIKK